MQKAQPRGSQVGSGLCLSPQRVRGDKAGEVNRLCPPEPGVHGPAQLGGEYGQRFSFAGFAVACGAGRFPGLTLAEEEHGGCGKGPAQRDGAALLA